MSSSRVHTTFTGFPIFFDNTAASTAKSGNDFRPPLRRLRPGRLADSASAPTLPPFHRDTPPAPPAAPSKRALAAARNIPPQSLFRPSQTPRPRSQLLAPLSLASARSLPTPSGTARS